MGHFNVFLWSRVTSFLLALATLNMSEVLYVFCRPARLRDVRVQLRVEQTEQHCALLHQPGRGKFPRTVSTSVTVLVLINCNVSRRFATVSRTVRTARTSPKLAERKWRVRPTSGSAREAPVCPPSLAVTTEPTVQEQTTSKAVVRLEPLLILNVRTWNYDRDLSLQNTPTARATTCSSATTSSASTQWRSATECSTATMAPTKWTSKARTSAVKLLPYVHEYPLCIYGALLTSLSLQDRATNTTTSCAPTTSACRSVSSATKRMNVATTVTRSRKCVVSLSLSFSCRYYKMYTTPSVWIEIIRVCCSRTFPKSYGK